METEGGSSVSLTQVLVAYSGGKSSRVLLKLVEEVSWFVHYKNGELVHLRVTAIFFSGFGWGCRQEASVHSQRCLHWRSVVFFSHATLRWYCLLHLQAESAISEQSKGLKNADWSSVLSVALKTGFPVYSSRLEEARECYDEEKQTYDVERWVTNCVFGFSFTRYLVLAKLICWTVCQGMMESLRWIKKACPYCVHLTVSSDGGGGLLTESAYFNWYLWIPWTQEVNNHAQLSRHSTYNPASYCLGS